MKYNFLSSKLLLILGLLNASCMLADVEPQQTKSSFVPNKRHMHQKETPKKQMPERKKNSKTARSHAKTHRAQKTTSTKSTAVAKPTEKQKAPVSHHHENKKARHHKAYAEQQQEIEKNIIQRTWAKIKAFFSRIKKSS